MKLIQLQEKIVALRAGSGLVCDDQLMMKEKVRLFQNNRLRATYQDLHEDDRMRPAAQFFLDYLYGTENLKRRDEQAQRVLPKADKYLPSKAVAVLELVLEMDLLAEEMDSRLASVLLKHGSRPDQALEEDRYLQAFRDLGEESVRQRQIDLVPEVGSALAGLLRLPLLAGILKMTRGAAQKAQLEEFHQFLEMGVVSFKRLKNPRDFLAIIVRRERHLLDLIYRDRVLAFPSYQSMPR